MPDTFGIKKPMVVNAVFAVYRPLLQLYESVLNDSSKCQPFQPSLEQWNEVDYQMTVLEAPCLLHSLVMPIVTHHRWCRRCRPAPWRAGWTKKAGARRLSPTYNLTKYSQNGMFPLQVTMANESFKFGILWWKEVKVCDPMDIPGPWILWLHSFWALTSISSLQWRNGPSSRHHHLGWLGWPVGGISKFSWHYPMENSNIPVEY